LPTKEGEMSARASDKLSDWLTTAEAAEILDVTPRRVRQLAKVEQRIGYKMMTDRLMLVKRSDVLRLAEARR